MTKLISTIVALCLLSAAASAETARKLSFNGSDLSLAIKGNHFAEFRSSGDPDFVETVLVRQLEASLDYSNAVRDLVKRAKITSHGAKLKMLERSNAKDIIVIYLADEGEKVIYKAERLYAAVSTSDIITLSYEAKFEAGNIDDEQTAKIKATAVDALAKFDLSSAALF